MTSDDLTTALNRIRTNLAAGRFRNETSVREAIVNPLLDKLGWDIYDPVVVIREHNLDGRRVDYALSLPDRSPSAIIEVKGVGQIVTGGGDRQLFEYAFHQGVPMAILTDGREWHFYLPGEQGDYSERRVYKLDLIERDASHSAQILNRYLGFQRVESGEALNVARQDYRSAARHRKSEQTLPRAWKDILDDRDEILIELIAEKTESLCGIRPDAEQVETFIAEQLAEQSNFESPSRKAERTRGVVNDLDDRTIPTSFEVRPKSQKHRTSRAITFELFGEGYKAKSAKEALIKILKLLSKDDPKFYEKLAPKAASRTRNHIASAREAVYPERPDLIGTVTQIAPGWWIGLNIANREKLRIIRAACEVAGVSFGSDVKIDLPNA